MARLLPSSSTIPPMISEQDEEMTFSDGEECIVHHQTDLPNIAMPVMDDIRRMDKLCDVTIKVGEHKYRSHRIVLAATIPYFHAMFMHGMKESRQDEIEVKGVEADAMEALINFAYSGKVTISTSSVHSLMMGASFLSLHRVREACEEFLIKRLTPTNVLGIQQFADALSCLKLMKACDNYVQRFFNVVSTAEEFLNLTFEKVQELVSSDYLHVSSEEIVFKAVIRWVKYDVNARQKQLPDLLNCVRMPLLTPQFLSDHVATEDLVKSDHKCRDLLDEARDYHLLPDRRQSLAPYKTRERFNKDWIGIIYAVGGQTKSGNSLSTVEVFDPRECLWRDAEAMSMHRSRVGVAVMKNRLYAIGGYNGTERLNTVEVFDPESKRWSRVASMNCKRSAVGAVSVGEFLYVCGGFDGISSLDTVERYDPDKNTWTLVSNMSKHRSAAGVVQISGKIYALGGHNGLSIFESVECLDTSTGKWTEVTPMLTKRCRLGVATLRGKIYACGGYDGSSFLKSVEVFDPATNRWTYVSPMNVTRSRVALVSNCDRLYAIGGYDGMKNLSTVEMYNPDTDEWKFVAAMESHEGGVGVGVIPMTDLIEKKFAELMYNE